MTEVITKIIGFVLAILLARHLGDAGYGKYAFAISFTAFFAIFANLGLSTLTTREVAKDKSLFKKYFENLSLIKLVLSLLAMIFIVVSINLLNYPSDTTLIVYIIGFYAVLVSFNDFFISIFRAFEKMEYEAIVRTIEKVIALSLIVIFISLGYGLVKIALAVLVSAIVSFLINLIFIFKRFIKYKLSFEIDFNFLKKSIKQALPFALTGFFTLSYFKFDTIILSFIKGNAVVGWYNAAYNIVFSLMAVPAVYGTVIFPVMSRYFKSSKDGFEKLGTLSFKYLFLFGLPTTLGITFLANKIMILVYGNQYLGGIVALQILIWSFFVMCIDTISTCALNSSNKQHIITISIAISALLNVILDFILIPKYSLVGAAISTVIACSFSFFFNFIFLNKYRIKISLIDVNLAKVILASSVMGFFVFYSSLNMWITILLAVILYGGIIFVTKTLSKEDLEIFKKIFFRNTLVIKNTKNL